MTLIRKSLTIGLFALVMSIGLAGCAPGWDKSSFTLEDHLTNPDDVVTSNEKDETKTLCSGLGGCLEGWTTDQGDYLRFESNAEAERFASTLDDGYQSNRVVIDFDRAQPEDDVKDLLIEGVESIHNSN